MGGLRGRLTIGNGPIESFAGQRETTVEAGTHGRLLRLCMNIARNHPEWHAVGQIEAIATPQGTRLRQRIVRKTEVMKIPAEPAVVRSTVIVL